MVGCRIYGRPDSSGVNWDKASDLQYNKGYYNYYNNMGTLERISMEILMLIALYPFTVSSPFSIHLE
jgi:hypothetical protein